MKLNDKLDIKKLIKRAKASKETTVTQTCGDGPLEFCSTGIFQAAISLVKSTGVKVPPKKYSSLTYSY